MDRALGVDVESALSAVAQLFLLVPEYFVEQERLLRESSSPVSLLVTAALTVRREPALSVIQPRGHRSP